MTTPLYPTFRKRVDDAIQLLIKQQVTPWHFLTAGPPFRVKRFDGQPISYQGIGYEGSPATVFWGHYIEPFLEDISIAEIAAAVSMAQQRNVDGKLLLVELQGLLVSGYRKVYAEMAEVDRRQRGKGFPEKITPRQTEIEFQKMNRFLEERIQAELRLWDMNLDKVAPSSDTISEEGRRTRFEQWDKIGWELIKQDLASGGYTYVGGPPQVRELARQYVQLREEESRSKSISAMRSADEFSAPISQIALDEIRVELLEIKNQIQALAISNALKTEIDVDIKHIEIESERPSPRKGFIKLFLESLRNKLAEEAAKKVIASAVKYGAVLYELLSKHF